MGNRGALGAGDGDDDGPRRPLKHGAIVVARGHRPIVVLIYNFACWTDGVTVRIGRARP